MLQLRCVTSPMCCLHHATFTTIMAEGWKLYYWPGFPGRGELVRLMFEELGISYEDVGVTKGAQEVLKLMRGEHGGWPVRAPPIIQNGDFFLSQTHAIIEYLGKKFGAWPKGGIEEEARAAQINMMVQDLLEEACSAYHPMERSATYESQKEAAIPYIAKFRKERIPKYLNTFEQMLKFNNEGKGFFFGNSLTYVDIVILGVMRPIASLYPEEYKSLDIPLLRGFTERMESRPNIASYLKSPRSQPYSDNSLM